MTFYDNDVKRIAAFNLYTMMSLLWNIYWNGGIHLKHVGTNNLSCNFIKLLERVLFNFHSDVFSQNYSLHTNGFDSDYMIGYLGITSKKYDH